jgi:hypothetical protein
MQTCRFLPLVVVAVSLSAADVVHADKWAPPKPRIFASSWGNYGFKLLNPQSGGPSQGMLFHLDNQGKEVIDWQKPLVNTPQRVFVDDQTKQVVTIDTYGSAGYAHALVLYDDKGNVVKDYALEDVLTADEIKTKVPTTAGSRWWVKDAKFAFEGNQFRVHLAWGRTIQVNLQTGKLGG